MLENKGFDKYSVKIDGSGRITDRNRRFLRAFRPSEAPKILAPRFPVEEKNTMHEPDELIQRQNVHVDVPRTEENPSVVIGGREDPPPVIIGIEPAEVDIPSLQPSPSAHTPPPPAAPSPVARSQRIKKPSSLLNPDIWDLNTVQTVPNNLA